jgi:hypothetical protein
MIGRVITSFYGLQEDEDLLFVRWKDKPHSQVPLISVIHDDRPMLKTPKELLTSKARYKNKRVILLVRDPRDVIVSSYFEMKNRGDLFGKNPYEKRSSTFRGTLPEFIHQEAGGFETILTYYNIWAANRDTPKGFLLIRYEDLKTDSIKELRRVLDFLEISNIPDTILKEAVEFASFENMRKMEAEGRFSHGMIKPADKTKVETYKTRKGKVHGYLEYLDDIELSYVNERMQEVLSPYYGYTN